MEISTKIFLVNKMSKSIAGPIRVTTNLFSTPENLIISSTRDHRI